jgi:hypothetical protein
LWNTVLGHDNTYHGAESYDLGFVYMNSGKLHLGDYNSSAAHINTSIEHPADINRSLSLQVQGKAYIKELTHGLPQRATAVANGGESSAQGSLAVETVEGRPHVLIQPGRRLVITNLTLNTTSVASSRRGRVVSAAYYEITLSGAGMGGECSVFDGGYAVFSAYIHRCLSATSADCM